MLSIKRVLGSITASFLMLGTALAGGLEAPSNQFKFDISTERKVCQMISEDISDIFVMWDQGWPIEIIRADIVQDNEYDPIVRYPLDILVDVISLYQVGSVTYMNWLWGAEEICVDVIGPDYRMPENDVRFRRVLWLINQE